MAQNYKLKFRDFIPFNIGTLIYINRNQQDTSTEADDNSSKIAISANGLFYYNIGVGVVLTALAVFGAIKGLESLIN